MAEENLLADLIAERQKYGATMNDDQCAELCNAVAWKNRASGWGLSGKDFGTHATLHDGTKVAHDILHHRPSNQIYDVLTAAGAASTPTWGHIGPPPGSNRPWVAPIQPKDSGVKPPPPPPPPSPKVPAYEAIGGDAVFRQQIGVVLQADYHEAGQQLNDGSAVWFARPIYDAMRDMIVNGTDPRRALDAAIGKHRGGWRAALGLPPR